SVRVWHSAARWLSPTLVVARFEQEALGRDGEKYEWTHIDVAEIRSGRFASICLFELDDEEAAFAYAEERERTINSRLATTNRASQTTEAITRAMSAADVDDAVRCFADSFEYDDHRRISGDPVVGLEAMRLAAGRLLEQYTRFEIHTFAVR